MASRNDVYQKFGITAETAQLFETALGTALLGIHGLNKKWHLKPNPDEATAMLDGIQKSTLGKLLREARKYIELDESMAEIFDSALQTRNSLIHGFFERHNLKMTSDDGRDHMMSDLESMHSELFKAWQVADKISEVIVRENLRQRDASE